MAPDIIDYKGLIKSIPEGSSSSRFVSSVKFHPDCVTVHWPLNVNLKVPVTLRALHWSKEALSYLWCSPRTQGILIPIIPLCQLLCCYLFCLVLPSLFGEESSLQSVIPSLQRDRRCLSALRNRLPAPNLKIKKVRRKDCPHSSHRWQAWPVVRASSWKRKPTNDLRRGQEAHRLAMTFSTMSSTNIRNPNMYNRNIHKVKATVI